MEGHEKCALRKKPVIAPFVEQFKLATLKTTSLWIPFLFTRIYLQILFLLTFCY